MKGEKAIDSKTDEWKEEWEKWSSYIRQSGLGKRRHFPKVATADNPNIALFSYFKGEQLGYGLDVASLFNIRSYVAARKAMYVQWYWELVQKTEAFKYLKEVCSIAVMDTIHWTAFRCWY